MESSDYLVWDVDPTAFTVGTLELPFPIAIWGLLAAGIMIWWGWSKIAPETTGREQASPESWKIAALVIGSLVVGQLIFLLFPSPEISQIGPIAPRWYGILFAGAFLAGYVVESKMFHHAGRTQEELERLLTYVLIATVIGARLGHVIFYDLGFYLRNPAEILAIWHGGLASHGAAIGILLAMYLYVQKKKDMSFLWLADRVVVVVALGGAFIRTGNFINSEIIGKATDLPWAVIFPRLDMVPRHPTMLYEAVWSLVVFGILWAMYKRYRNNPPEGSLFATFLVLLFSGRFLLEFTKINQAAFTSDWALNMGQWLSLPLIAVGIWLIVKKVRWKRNNSRPAGTT